MRIWGTKAVNKTEEDNKKKKFSNPFKKDSNFRKFLKKRKKLVIIAVVIIAVILFVLSKFVFPKNDTEGAVATDVQVEKRTIVNTITGSSTLVPNDSYNITSLVTGDVIYAPFEEGDIVEEDDVLYRIDDSDLSNSLSSSNISLQRSVNNYNDAVEARNELTLISDYTGNVTKVYVEEGDNVNAGTTIADVVDNSHMLLDVPFNDSDANNIYEGQSAVVTTVDTNTTMNGVVTKVYSNTEVKNGYAIVRNVEIRVENPGALSAESKATAVVGGMYCNDAGTFKLATEETIKATASGKIATLHITEGGKVTKGMKVISYDMEDANESVNNASLSLQEAQLSSERIREQQEDYEIKAPISGTIIAKYVKSGDKIDNGTNATGTLAIIYDMTCLKFELSIDETEIGKVFVGQPVNITADAVSGTFTGVVDNVSINGTSSNGVTTYPVTVVMTEYGDLLPGMNVDAEIVITQATDVLSVPVSAIRRGNMVYVKGDKTEKEDNAPDGYKTVTVETGITDSMYIEIKSGLTIDDIVLDESVVAENGGMMMMGMPGAGGMQGMGGMSGGMGGGMPGGGNMGGNRSGGMGGGGMR